MGGRGAMSYGGRTIRFAASDNGEPGLAAPEQRRDLRDAARALGFRDAYNTSSIDREVMEESLSALSALEKKYGAIGSSTDAVLNGVKTDAIAYVHRDKSDPSNQTLSFSVGNMGSAEHLVGATRKAVQQGHFMPSGMSRSELIRYTARHEYGHMVENVLSAKSGMKHSTFVVKTYGEITDIARKKFGADVKKDVSKYGKSNGKEFFAEAFANAHSEKPNGIGLAMREWLRQKGF